MSETPELPEWSIGPGWIKLVQDLIKDLEQLELSEIHQIKEKFGTLRIYASCASQDPQTKEKFNQRIWQAEDESAKICEQCGSREQVESDSWNGYWVKTLCQLCGNKIRK